MTSAKEVEHELAELSREWPIPAPVRSFIDRLLLSAAKPPAIAADAVARREAAMLVMEMAEDRDPDNVAEMFRIYENAPHDCEERTGVRKPYGCGRCDVERAYAAADRIRSALSPAATSGSEAGGDLTRMIARLPDDFVDDGNCCAGKLKPQVRPYEETLSAGSVVAEHFALAKPASSPTGGDVREIDEISEAIGKTGMIVRGDGSHTVIPIAVVARLLDLARAALSPSAAEPVAWVIPGDDNARDDGSIDAMAWQEGEFTRALYATPPAPAAVDGQRVRVKPLEWQERPGDEFCNICWLAPGLGDSYTIEERRAGVFDLWLPTLSDGTRYGTREEAVAAAQADYEARIRACLATDKEGDDVRNR